jgi:hypothetical protein
MDAYYQAFEGLFKETVDRTGIEVPYELEIYTIRLMAHYINRNDIDADETFAEQYLKAITQYECKIVGDRALMVYGWFPVRRQHKGITISYYADIGKAAYSRCNASVFGLLIQHFDIVGEVMRHIPTQEVNSLVNLD